MACTRRFELCWANVCSGLRCYRRESEKVERRINDRGDRSISEVDGGLGTLGIKKAWMEMGLHIMAEEWLGINLHHVSKSWGLVRANTLRTKRWDMTFYCHSLGRNWFNTSMRGYL